MRITALATVVALGLSGAAFANGDAASQTSDSDTPRLTWTLSIKSPSPR